MTIAASYRLLKVSGDENSMVIHGNSADMKGCVF